VTIRIDELTGLPTTRTGTVPHEPGALGPGARHGDCCVHLTRLDCPGACPGGWWDIWLDLDSEEYVFIHHWTERTFHNVGWDGTWSTQPKWTWRKFDRFHVCHTKEWSGTPEGCVAYLARHEAHPVNAPTPGKARR
jgi:hypothetical protein